MAKYRDTVQHYDTAQHPDTLLPPTRQSTQQNIHWVQTPLHHPDATLLDTRHLRMDALPVALCELNGNTFQSTGGRTAKLLRKCSLGMWRRGIVHISGSVVQQPLTTIRTPSKVVSGPFWPAESNCNSIYPWLCWLLQGRPEHPQSLKAKNSARTSSAPVITLSTTIKNLVSMVSRPIRRAESSRSLHFTIAPLVVELQAKRLKIPQVKIPPKGPSPPCTASPTYNQNSVEGCP
jgi:hypothetical protein